MNCQFSNKSSGCSFRKTNPEFGTAPDGEAITGDAPDGTAQEEEQFQEEGFPEDDFQREIHKRGCFSRKRRFGSWKIMILCTITMVTYCSKEYCDFERGESEE